MFKGAFYKHFKERKSWKDAESACNKLGAHLTSILVSLVMILMEMLQVSLHTERIFHRCSDRASEVYNSSKFEGGTGPSRAMTTPQNRHDKVGILHAKLNCCHRCWTWMRNEGWKMRNDCWKRGNEGLAHEMTKKGKKWKLPRT